MRLHDNLDASYKCHICYGRAVRVHNDFSKFSRVTSDCRLWPKGGKLGVCGLCGSVQKVIDGDFSRDCSVIYDSYSVYHQGEGQEQRVFEQLQGQSQFRSELLLTKVLKQFDLPLRGNLLDVGCGNGSLLRSFSKLRPLWALAGSELNDNYRQVVEQIENVRAFYSCDFEEIPGSFDMISMIHCLEHVVDPISFLRKVMDKITDEGVLLLEVPDYRQNPFDLVIVDHCSHFDIENLERLLHVSGLEILIGTNRYVPKELTFLVRKRENSPDDRTLEGKSSPCQDVRKSLRWLKQTVREAGKIAGQGKLGLFGTSIAAVWLCGELGDIVSFFVDEDPSRIGKGFMDRRVYHPKDVPAGWHVFIAFPFSIATEIWKRMQSFNARFYVPPDFEQ